MRIRRALPAVLVALAASSVLAACSEEIDGKPRAAGIPVTEQGDTFSDPDDGPDGPGRADDEVAALLLTLDDLPPGWVVDRSEDDGDDTEDELDRCIDGLDAPELLGDARGSIEGEAEIEFKAPDDITSLSQSLSKMEFAEDTSIFLDAMSSIFDSCSEGSFDVDGQEAQASITPAPIADIGDDARSWVLSIDVGIAVEIRFAVITKDEYVMMLIYGDPFSDTAAADLEDIARIAVARL